MPAYTLYEFESCPYCQKVFRFMEQNGITLEMKNTLAPGIKDELVRIGGKYQVPCLVIDGKALYESDDIIEYMRAHKEEMTVR